MNTYSLDLPVLAETVSVSKYRYVKRGLDIAFSLFSILVFSPAILVIYFLILFQKDGPVLFKQERVGYKGKKFILYKFRTMTTKAEENGVPQLCKEGDVRLTKVGKFLRQHHLDEFPQLWNVLVGDMSFVGYRPERQYFIEQIRLHNPGYDHLFNIRPGLFSEATLFNGYTDTMPKMLRRLQYDLDYLNNCSLKSDLRIIFLTSMFIISGKKF